MTKSPVVIMIVLFGEGKNGVLNLKETINCPLQLRCIGSFVGLKFLPFAF